MLPIVTIRELLGQLEAVLDGGYDDSAEVVLTTSEDPAFRIGLGLIDDDGGVTRIPGVAFRGMVEL